MFVVLSVPYVPVCMQYMHLWIMWSYVYIRILPT